MTEGRQHLLALCDRRAGAVMAFPAGGGYDNPNSYVLLVEKLTLNVRLPLQGVLGYGAGFHNRAEKAEKAEARDHGAGTSGLR